MSELDRNCDAVTANAAPAACEVPEQEVQADVDASLVDDRQIDGEVAGSLHRTGHQSGNEARVAARDACELLVEDGDASGFEHAPFARPAERQRLGILLPRPQQVALAEQLGASAAIDAHLPHEYALHHQ